MNKNLILAKKLVALAKVLAQQEAHGGLYDPPDDDEPEWQTLNMTKRGKAVHFKQLSQFIEATLPKELFPSLEPGSLEIHDEDGHMLVELSINFYNFKTGEFPDHASAKKAFDDFLPKFENFILTKYHPSGVRGEIGINVMDESTEDGPRFSLEITCTDERLGSGPDFDTTDDGFVVDRFYEPKSRD